MVVVQSVLLFGSKMWVLSPWLKKSLKGFHHLEVRRIEGIGTKNKQDGTRMCTPIGMALAMVGLEEIGVYIDRRLLPGMKPWELSKKYSVILLRKEKNQKSFSFTTEASRHLKIYIVKRNFPYINTLDHEEPAVVSAMRELISGVFQYLDTTSPM